MKTATRLLLAVVSFLSAQSLFAQQTAGFQQTVHVTAIEVVADVRDQSGKVPGGLTPADFTLLEDGVRQKIVSVEYLRPRIERTAGSAPAAAAPTLPRREWQTILYFETQLTHGESRKRVAEELGKQAETLVALGPVDVILANPAPTALIRQTRDAAALRQALRKAGNAPGMNQLFSHRAHFLNHVRQMTVLADMRATASRAPGSQRNTRSAPMGVPAGMESSFKEVTADTARPYIAEELSIIRRFRDNLTGWLGSYRRTPRRALVMVTNGFDLDPLEFYSTMLDKNEQISLRTYVEQSSAGQPTERFVQTLAGAGWTIFSFPGDHNPAKFLEDASIAGAGRMGMEVSSPYTPQTGPKAVLLRPFDPLHLAADQSGGAVVVNNARLAETLDRLNDRVVITYQVDRPADGKRRSVELKPHDRALKVTAAKWASSATSQEIAEARALRLLTTAVPGSDLPLITAATWNAAAGTKRRGIIEAKADMKSITAVMPHGSQGDFRVTFAIRVPPTSAVVRSVLVRGYDLSSGEFRFRAPIDVSANASQIIMTVEEVNTGMWGSGSVPVE